jgi:hypothetical protein
MEFRETRRPRNARPMSGLITLATPLSWFSCFAEAVTIDLSRTEFLGGSA